MKRLFQLIFVIFISYAMLVFGADTKIVKKETCAVKGYAIWEFNEYVGKKPDIGAVVYLFQRFERKKYLIVKEIFEKRTNKKNGVYINIVSTDGKHEIKNLPPGKYDCLIVSNATNRNISVKYDPNINHFEKYQYYLKLGEDSRKELRKDQKSAIWKNNL